MQNYESGANPVREKKTQKLQEASLKYTSELCKEIWLKVHLQAVATWYVLKRRVASSDHGNHRRKKGLCSPAVILDF